jgi:hypothetical protein
MVAARGAPEHLRKPALAGQDEGPLYVAPRIGAATGAQRDAAWEIEPIAHTSPFHVGVDAQAQRRTQAGVRT